MIMAAMLPPSRVLLVLGGGFDGGSGRATSITGGGGVTGGSHRAATLFGSGVEEFLFVMVAGLLTGSFDGECYVEINV